MKKRWAVIICYLVTFAAGTAMGLVAQRRAPQFPDRHSFVESLGLSDEQQQKMHDIWETTMRDSFHSLDDRRRAASKQRNDAVRALLTPEQQTQYDAIYKAYDEQTAEISKARREAFESAQAQTRELLTPDQQVKYDALMAERRKMFENRGGPGRHGHEEDDHRNPPPSAPTPSPSPSTTPNS
ncbi:MAG: hypothetical protein GC162_01280 [Planctomycetes bacterium]|nr:hypothetical protein [Planctomycetota bacterium]